MRCGVCSAAVNGALPSLSKFSSVSAILKRVEPQSKQTNISGNVRTPGFSRCLRPLKWIINSAVNSASFVEEHNLQLIARLLLPANYTNLTVHADSSCSWGLYFLAQMATPWQLIIMTGPEGASLESRNSVCGCRRSIVAKSRYRSLRRSERKGVISSFRMPLGPRTHGLRVAFLHRRCHPHRFQ
jgi:hypothetical protein